jgi:hypothetical protein
VPGSHKAALPLPNEWRDSNTTGKPPFIGMGAAEIYGGVVPAGSAVIFCEQTTHGTMAWRATNGRQRKTLFYKWSPPAVSWSSDFFDPAMYATRYPELGEDALQRLEPPNARYGNRAQDRQHEAPITDGGAAAEHNQRVQAHASARM